MESASVAAGGTAGSAAGGAKEGDKGLKNGGGEVPTHREAVEKFGGKVTKQASERASAAGVEPEVELVNKHSAQALADVAKQSGAELIVVGSHGEAPLAGAILGTTPHKLLHLWEVPVWLCRRRKRSRDRPTPNP